ncbi:hypothetical protein SeMB42_g03011 [Synchytrium endobioticum]|uniref:Uncharacterized protein n=1 Tax=Synchytrium endobioticum TaxID=286115 RepID=A0A507DAL4_9FUNG|nr:hypothetical protein SeMB42_g03011 [Synchytrium endobioticum]
MMPPNTPTAPDDLAEVIFPNLDISARQLEVVWSTVYQVLLRLGDANRLPFCSSVFNAGDLKLNRFLGLHLFLLQAISNRDHIVSETDEVPGVKPSKGFARAKVMEIWEHVHTIDTKSPVQDRILSKPFHCQVTHLLHKAWRDLALVEDGIEQGLRLLRDEDKGLKWTKKAQFGSEIRNVFQQVASSVKGREFKVKKNPPRNVKAASFSPLPTTSLGARFMYINTTALLEINNAIIDINTSAQERAHILPRPPALIILKRPVDFAILVINCGGRGSLQQLLKLNRFPGLHLFLLQAISNRDRIVSENDEVPGVEPSPEPR